MRLIDANEAKEALTGWDTDPTDEEIERTIDGLPTIEAAPVVHGRWVLVKPRRTGRNATYKCTACGQLRSSYYNDVTRWKHCPCGARMDGDAHA